MCTKMLYHALFYLKQTNKKKVELNPVTLFIAFIFVINKLRKQIKIRLSSNLKFGYKFRKHKSTYLS